MKSIFNIIFLSLICIIANGQYVKVLSFATFDSIYNANSFNIITLKVNAKIHSFGKSGIVPIRELDSAGFLSRKKYNTSFTVTLLDDTTSFYVPVTKSFFKKWHKKYYYKTQPANVQLTIIIYPIIRKVKNKHFFVINKIKFID